MTSAVAFSINLVRYWLSINITEKEMHLQNKSTVYDNKPIILKDASCQVCSKIGYHARTKHETFHQRLSHQLEWCTIHWHIPSICKNSYSVFNLDRISFSLWVISLTVKFSLNFFTLSSLD